MYLEYKWHVEEELKEIIARQKTGEAREEDVSTRAFLQSRLEKLENNSKYKESYKRSPVEFA